MLICKDVTVDWMASFSNSPKFVVHLDRPVPPWPKIDEPAWELRDRLHVNYAENGFVHFFATDGLPTDGFGGATFSGRFLSGIPFKYTGAWSSRAGAYNRRFPERRAVDVTVVQGGTWYGGLLSGHVLADELIEWRRANDRDWGMSWVDDGEVTLEATRSGLIKGQNEAYRRVLRLEPVL